MTVIATQKHLICGTEEVSVWFSTCLELGPLNTVQLLYTKTLTQRSAGYYD